MALQVSVLKSEVGNLLNASGHIIKRTVIANSDIPAFSPLVIDSYSEENDCCVVRLPETVYDVVAGISIEAINAGEVVSRRYIVTGNLYDIDLSGYDPGVSLYPTITGGIVQLPASAATFPANIIPQEIGFVLRNETRGELFVSCGRQTKFVQLAYAWIKALNAKQNTGAKGNNVILQGGDGDGAGDGGDVLLVPGKKGADSTAKHGKAITLAVNTLLTGLKYIAQWHDQVDGYIHSATGKLHLVGERVRIRKKLVTDETTDCYVDIYHDETDAGIETGKGVLRQIANRFGIAKRVSPTEIDKLLETYLENADIIAEVPNTDRGIRLKARHLKDYAGNRFFPVASGQLENLTKDLFYYDGGVMTRIPAAAGYLKYSEENGYSFQAGGTLGNTDNLPEGLTNLYYTNDRVDAEIRSYLNLTVGVFDIQVTAALYAPWSGLTGAMPDLGVFPNAAGFLTSVTWAQLTGTKPGVAFFDNDANYLSSVSWSIIQDKPDSDQIPEGSTHLYYTAARVQALIPTVVSAFTNDAGYLTSVAWSSLIGDKPPVSDFSNDMNYLSSGADLNNIIHSEILSYLGFAAGVFGITVEAANHVTWSGINGQKPGVAFFDNDAHYLTSIPDTDGITEGVNHLFLTNGRVQALIPSAVSSFSNDAGYLNASGVNSAIESKLGYGGSSPGTYNIWVENAKYAQTSLWSGLTGAMPDLGVFPNAAGFLTSVTWAQLTGTKPGVAFFNNDAHYLTSMLWSDLQGDKPDLGAFPNAIGYVTSVGWAQLTGTKPGVSYFNNDMNYLTSVSWDIITGATKPNVSIFPNDAAYIDLSHVTWAVVQSNGGTPPPLSTFANNVGYITTAALLWGNIAGRPTNVSAFNNDMNYVSYGGIGWNSIGTSGSPKPTTIGGYGITDAVSSSVFASALGAHTYADFGASIDADANYLMLKNTAGAQLSAVGFEESGIWTSIWHPTTISGYGITDAVSASGLLSFGYLNAAGVQSLLNYANGAYGIKVNEAVVFSGHQVTDFATAIDASADYLILKNAANQEIASVGFEEMGLWYAGNHPVNLVDYGIDTAVEDKLKSVLNYQGISANTYNISVENAKKLGGYAVGTFIASVSVDADYIAFYDASGADKIAIGFEEMGIFTSKYHPTTLTGYGITDAEPAITTKGTAFNKNFGATSNTVSEGNHAHSNVSFTTSFINANGDLESITVTNGSVTAHSVAQL